MNRTISCTVNDQALAEAFAFLTRSGYTADTLAGITRLCVELVAAQLENILTKVETEQYTAIATTGRVSKQKPQFGRVGLKTVAPVEQRPEKPTALTQPWWQQLGCCSNEEGLRYTTWLREQGLTAQECSYTEWHKRLACAENKVEQTEVPNELESVVAERLAREQEEKLAMEQFTRSLLNGQKNS